MNADTCFLLQWLYKCNHVAVTLLRDHPINTGVPLFVCGKEFHEHSQGLSSKGSHFSTISVY